MVDVGYRCEWCLAEGAVIAEPRSPFVDTVEAERMYAVIEYDTLPNSG